MTMAIIESTKSQIAGVDVQPIINHGTPAWRIFKPGGGGLSHPQIRNEYTHEKEK